MDKKLICENKFQFMNRTICLPIKMEDLPNKLIIEGSTLLLKTSFHVSLVCIGEIIKKHNISISNFENKIIDDFCEFSRVNEVKVLKYDDFRFVTRDDLKSVVVMCEILNLEKFFEIIDEKYELNIEYPPTHITLYTLESKPGIFLTDANDIKNLTKPISNPTGHLL